MRSLRYLPAILAVACLSQTAAAQIKIIPRTKAVGDDTPPPPMPGTTRNLLLTDQRTYRFDVAKLDPKVYVKIERNWSFGKSFPAGLVAAVRKHGKFKKLDAGLLGNKQGEPPADGGYIRWESAGKKSPDTGALLTIIDGPRRKLLGLRVDLLLDHKLGDGKPFTLTFDGLSVEVQLENGKLGDVKWDGRELPATSDKTRAVIVEDGLEVDVLGMLTDKSSKSLRAADELVSGELLQSFQLLGMSDLKNISHHGITLGWLGHENLRHHLSLLAGKRDDPIAFRYRVAGDSFPIKFVRRQLQPDGWPLVLTGHRYVGSTADGMRVFRPVEFVLSKEAAATTKPATP
jgi:hypothetical protein